MRKLIAFPCVGATLVGSLDEAAGSTGLLIVSGGSEIRCGAHRGMALLGQQLAEAGYPVFRYDRRGVGDSTGENLGWRESAPDIAAAAATFSAEVPQLRRLVAFGNCDAATALALFHRVAAIDALVLANPWAVEQTDSLPPAAAIRARYAERLRDPHEWRRLLTGGVSLRKLASGLWKISADDSEESSGLATELIAALGNASLPVTLLLAERDNTAIAFASAWQHATALPARYSVERRDTASHSFASPEDKAWLFERVLAALEA
jgi:exosortase A-associated hydrolase 1